MTKKRKSGKVEESQTQNTIGNEKLCAILSYILIGIIWYFVDENIKKDSFAKFHAKQGLILLIFEVIYSLVLGILLFPIMIVSLGLLMPIVGLLYYLPLIWVIIGVVNAINGQQKELPLIGQFAKKLSI